MKNLEKISCQSSYSLNDNEKNCIKGGASVRTMSVCTSETNDPAYECGDDQITHTYDGSWSNVASTIEIVAKPTPCPTA